MQDQNAQSIKYFIYARKSSESEDQQVASIGSQIKELETIAERDNLEVVAVLSEAQSAKAPGRSVFNEMLSRISQGEATGILCWKLDRLARNPVDDGNISWRLQQGIIQRIRTHDRYYYPTDNVLMMSVEFGMANQYVRDLSHNVRRGLLAKVEKGWYPGVAKPGYVNAIDRAKGDRTTPKDPIRFPLLQRAFRRILSGLYTPPQVLNMLNNEWGYRTPKRRKLGGVPLPHSGFYRILTDPFYYGVFEYPKGSGNWYQGKHEPMISEEAFWQVQKLLGKRGRMRPQKHMFAFTGLIKCGECEAAITAETKDQVICSKCKFKFASRNRLACPKCTTPITRMKKPTHLHYEYYHCTKRKQPCSQRAIQVKELEAQIRKVLESITITEPMKDWFLRQIEAETQQDAKDRTPIREALQKAVGDTQKRIDNLFNLKISPQNSTGELLSDEEFANQKNTLSREMLRLKRKLIDVDQNADQWTDACAQTFHFACYARHNFEIGSAETRRAILSALGSNLVLEDKKLRIPLHKHLVLMQNINKGIKSQNRTFEPKKNRSSKRKNRALNPVPSTWRRGWDDVRTYFLQEALESVHIPGLTPHA